MPLKRAFINHQLLARPQIFNSRGSLFGPKSNERIKAQIPFILAYKCELYDQNHCLEPKYTQLVAKCTVNSSKTLCYLLQNGVRLAAKCKAKWCKTQGKMVQNAMRMHYFSCRMRVLCIVSFEELLVVKGNKRV
ncbi:MAG: hypothetical protein ACTTJY_00580 [Hoylesella shahii]|uniref:hypothetical protein n=1 Tax=Hoylesella shahii TaxID=228603 RepID=UPI003F9F68B5